MRIMADKFTYFTVKPKPIYTYLINTEEDPFCTIFFHNTPKTLFVQIVRNFHSVKLVKRLLAEKI